MNILRSISHEDIFRPMFGPKLSTWASWNVALRALYGIPLKDDSQRQLLLKCTGRSHETLPSHGFSTALFLTGRRSGKSRIAATIGAYEALLGGHEKKLANGRSW